LGAFAGVADPERKIGPTDIFVDISKHGHGPSIELLREKGIGPAAIESRVLDPSLESLHDEPEFQAMIAEIEADMAIQLARVREMERNGELEPIPEVSATIH
jgi:hypothetical protein